MERSRTLHDGRTMKRPVPLLLIAVALCVLPLALRAEGVLLLSLPGELPLGTLLAALALIAGATVPIAASRSKTPLRWAGYVALTAAVLWLPLGIYLSGNAALNFVNDGADSAAFWRLTAGLVAFVLATTLWSAVTAVLQRRSRASPPRAA